MCIISWHWLILIIRIHWNGIVSIHGIGATSIKKIWCTQRTADRSENISNETRFLEFAPWNTLHEVKQSGGGGKTIEQKKHKI